jgi:hypothetical protein
MVARVRAVREAIGPDIGLMVDGNQQLSLPEAIRLGRMLEPLNLRTAVAQRTRRTRSSGLPILEIRPSRSLPP